jgi:hypothetical protein
LPLARDTGARTSTRSASASRRVVPVEPGAALATERAPLRLADLRSRPALALALIATLVLLLAHSGRYAFLTDDAYISFRYARNLAHGHGLVFNPGGERVEGYSNFLWTVVLAGAAAAGIPPERAASPLSLAATVALWALVVAYALRHPPPAGHAWLIVVPAAWLALTRSVAVWSTSGLETRWFELLVVAGALRLLVEIGAARRGERHAPLAAVALGLAVLTRPDGMMIAAFAWATKLAAVAWSGSALEARRATTRGPGAQALPSGATVTRPASITRRVLPWAAIDLAVLAALIGGHLLFRLAYYGEWLPNTYYAKVGGRTWWSAGAAYARAFSLEYALVLWLPLLALGVVHHLRRGSAHVPALFAVIVVPHLLYVVAIGGDHFEYRPLDLYFPFAFLLMYDGAREWLSRPRMAPALAVWIALVTWGLWHLPDRTHREFPKHYLGGFPGLTPENPALGRRYMDPARDPVYSLPGLRTVGRQYQADLQRLTRNFIGVRQEEHRLFLATALAQGLRLRGLVEAGTLPRDVRIAMSCVGAIPYVSGIWTLDRLGLTDAHVAHSPFVARRFLAHDKGATLDYARERRIDLWTSDHVHTVVGADEPTVFAAVTGALAEGDSVYAAPVGDGEYVLAFLPMGATAAARRMPALSFRWCGDPALVQELLAQAIARSQAAIAADPTAYEKRRHLAFLFMLSGNPAEARARYAELVGEEPGDAEAWENLGLLEGQIGRGAEARAATEHALALAQQHGDTSAVMRLGQRLERWRTAPP